MYTIYLYCSECFNWISSRELCVHYSISIVKQTVIEYPICHVAHSFWQQKYGVILLWWTIRAMITMFSFEYQANMLTSWYMLIPFIQYWHFFGIYVCMMVLYILWGSSWSIFACCRIRLDMHFVKPLSHHDISTTYPGHFSVSRLGFRLWMSRLSYRSVKWVLGSLFSLFWKCWG